MGNYLLLLKTRAPMQMDLGRSAIVSFPSEHVVVALLAVRALAAIRHLRGWAWAIGALVCCSTITTGWHYAIDVLGGIVVAALAAWFADAVCTLLEKSDNPQASAASVPMA
jgi:membrane-associated phospholipid phosphatase